MIVLIICKCQFKFIYATSMNVYNEKYFDLLLDLLGKFPPDSVSMKLPLYMPPWGSSPELVKKLFKVHEIKPSFVVSMVLGVTSPCAHQSTFPILLLLLLIF